MVDNHQVCTNSHELGGGGGGGGGVRHRISVALCYKLSFTVLAEHTITFLF